MKILPIVLSNRQTGFKNAQKQTVNNAINQTTNSIYNNSKASFATKNLAFCALYKIIPEQLTTAEEVQKVLRGYEYDEDVPFLFVDIFDKNPKLAKEGDYPAIVNFVSKIKSPKTQLAVIKLFEKHPELAQAKNINSDTTALNRVITRAKTEENQLALIELLKKRPELATTKCDYYDKLTPPHKMAINFDSPKSQEGIIELLEENPELAKMQEFSGKTPLHYAAEYFDTPQGQQAFIDFINKYPELAKMTNGDNDTPLLSAFACFNPDETKLSLIDFAKKHTEIVKIADSTTKLTPIHYITMRYNTQKTEQALVKLFEEHPELATLKTKGNITPLCYTAQYFQTSEGRQALIGLLKKHPEMLEADGANVLKNAAKNFDTAQLQTALVEVFEQNLELAKEQDWDYLENKEKPCALRIALNDFKTPQGQRAIIKLLYEHPEIRY